MAKTTSLRWTKCPRDGTSYHYWEAPGGWVICTKPRFLPKIGYALEPPASWGAGVHLRFDTLALAQAAAEWPREQLLSHFREDYERFIAMLLGTPGSPEAVLTALHERARDEDLERSRARQVTPGSA
jgi:hypothetical protein